MKNRTLVYLTLIYIIGILLGGFLPLNPLIWVWVLAGVLVLWFLLYLKGEEGFGWLLLLAFFCLGAANYGFKNQIQIDLLKELPLNQEVELTGQIIGEPLIYSNRVVFDVKLPSKIKIRVNSRGEGNPWLGHGDTLFLKGKLERPAQARNPGEFNYREYLWQKGIIAELTIKPEEVKIISGNQHHWRKSLQKFKEKFNQLLVKYMSPEAVAVSKALILGDKTALEADVKSLFLALGIMHLLAVSGLHVGFLLVLVNLIKVMLRLKPKNAFILTVILLILYLALTNFAPSVLRAALMAFVVLLGNLLGKERDFYTSIALAAFILLLYNPFYLFYSGFQLSFAATWGLVYFTPLIDFLIPRKFPLKNLIVVPIAAQIAALPFTAYYFNLISLVGLLANLLIVPIAGFIVVAGLFALFISLFSTSLTSLLLIPLGAVIDLMLRLFTPIGAMSWSSMVVKTPSILTIILYYLFLIGLRELLSREDWLKKAKEKRLQIAFGILFLAVAIIGGKQLPTKPLEIAFLDVGQGDSIFIRTPKGTTILLDGGGNPPWQQGDFRVGKNIVVPYLQREGVKKVDLLISSHPDTDHMEGLIDVLAELGAKAILMPPKGIFGDEYQELLDLANLKRVQVFEGIAGDKIELDHGIRLEILNPPGFKRTFQTAPDNNHSLLVRLTYKNAYILLTGDLELEALEFLHKAGNTESVSVFKAPHHGSKTGLYEPYLDEIEPLAVIYSVGRNSYGHPSPVLIKYWEEREITGYRTDQNGAILIKTDGLKLNIKGFINVVD